MSTLATSSAVDTQQELMISADSHVSEPVDLWEERLPSSFRERAPNFKKSRSRGGKPPVHLKGESLTDAQKTEESKPVIFAERKAGTDPVKRLDEMLEDGVIAEVLYPSLGGKLFFIEDPALQEACVQVYNDWLAEYCSVSPDRLLGIAIVSTYDMDSAVKELTRCKKAGLKGATIWQLPPPDLSFTSDHYDPFWAAAQDLDMPVSLHINTGYRSRGYLEVHGLESYRRSINIKLEEVVEGLFDVIFSGVLERFPRLKLVIVENEIGWLPFWLEQCDKYYERHRLVEPLPIKQRPSEYFNRQVYATFFNDETGGRLLSWWGVDNCMWSNDYPHSNSTWPHSREVIARDLRHLSADDREKLTRLNVARLYQLTIPALAEKSESVATQAGVVSA